MSAFGRRRVRTLLLSGSGAAVIACAASLAWADAQLASGPTGAEPGAGVPILSPEAPLSFGDLGGASPLLAVFDAAPAARDPVVNVGWFAEPKVDLASPAAAASEAPAPPDIPPPVVYDPTAGPPLSPMQSALHATLREIAANLPPERRERFHALAQSEKLAEGEDRELAELLATVISGDEDAEAGTTQAPCADDLLAAATSLETPEPRLRGSRHRGRHGCGRGAGCSGRARRDLQASRVLSWLFLISSRPSLRADIVTRTASCARLLSTDKKRSKR